MTRNVTHPHVVSFRVSDEELLKLRLAAKRSGVKLNSYLRGLVVEQKR